MLKKIFALLKSSIFRWWLMIAAVFAIFPTCPCCGRQGCPGGFAAGAILGGILVAMRTAFLYTRDKLSVMIFRTQPAKKL